MESILKNKKIMLAAGLALLAIIIAIVVISSSGTSVNDNNQLSLGEKFLQEMDYDNAILAFTKVLKVDPMNTKAYFGLADAYIGNGDIDKAIKTLEKGLENTSDEKIKKKLDELLNTQGEYATDTLSEEKETLEKDLENTSDKETKIELDELLKGVYAFCSLNQHMFGVMNDDKWGLADYSGNLILPMEYEAIYEFKYGMASVKKDGKFGAVNLEGEVIVPFEYDTLYDYASGVACVQKNGKWGFIDTKGNIVVPLEYDRADTMFDGVAPVKKGDKWGYINSNNEIIYPFEADEACVFNDGLAMLKKYIADSSDIYIIDIDPTGKEITNTKYCMSSRGRYSESVTFHHDPTGRYILDLQGNRTPIKHYSEYYWFKNGLAKVTDYNGLSGFIDKTGKEVVPCQYEFASNFQNGYSWVGNNNVFGLIDTTGSFVIPMEVESFSDVSEDGLATYKLNGEWKIYDVNNPVV